MPTTDDDTPARLVAAFAQLVADGGQETISLRAVSRAANSNAAAVHYHFGGRDELLAAVIAELLEPVHRRRLELLDEARRRAPAAAMVRAVVQALVRPDLELLAGLRPDRIRVARLLGQPAAPGSAVAALVGRQFAAVAAKALPLLDPAVPPDEMRERVRWVLATSASVLATAGASAEPGSDEPGSDEPGSDEPGSDELDEGWLVGYCVAGLAAPPSPARRPPTPRDRPAKARAKKRHRAA